MGKLDESDVNGHGSKTNINHFVPLFESYYEQQTNHRTKLKTPIISLSEGEEGRVNKGDQNNSNEDDEDDWEKKIMEKMYDPDSDEAA